MWLGAHNGSEWPIKQLLKPSFTPGWRLKKRLSLFWTRKYKTVQCQEHRSIIFSCGHCWKDHTKSSFGKTSRLWAVSRTRDACVASNICSSHKCTMTIAKHDRITHDDNRNLYLIQLKIRRRARLRQVKVNRRFVFVALAYYSQKLWLEKLEGVVAPRCLLDAHSISCTVIIKFPLVFFPLVGKNSNQKKLLSLL